MVKLYVASGGHLQEYMRRGAYGKFPASEKSAACFQEHLARFLPIAKTQALGAMNAPTLLDASVRLLRSLSVSATNRWTTTFNDQALSTSRDPSIFAIPFLATRR